MPGVSTALCMRSLSRALFPAMTMSSISWSKAASSYDICLRNRSIESKPSSTWSFPISPFAVASHHLAAASGWACETATWSVGRSCKGLPDAFIRGMDSRGSSSVGAALRGATLIPSGPDGRGSRGRVKASLAKGHATTSAATAVRTPLNRQARTPPLRPQPRSKAAAATAISGVAKPMGRSPPQQDGWERGKRPIGARQISCAP
mmetsp:Transcript_103557/g.221480  ORF Transcript_103557/g.221480 Transcript_103557/m.221480 type:complete len:205 (+) Transcript_103557:271-885(+)